MEQNYLKIKCEDLLNETVMEIIPIPGGDLNQAYQIETKQNSYFCKANSSAIGEDLLVQEELNLGVISRYCRTPKVISSAPQIMLLSWVKPGKKIKRFWEELARELAAMHRVTSNQFGLDSNNYIGTLPQNNEGKLTWKAFFVLNRLMPQFDLALEKGLLTSLQVPDPERMQKVIGEVCPVETASLIHGDLWSGNILCDTEGTAYFIDPSISYAQREMDLAMSCLFGKFDKSFYGAYQEDFPLEPGFEKRMDIYHLYYLLAHLNLFGIGYKNDVIKICKHYFG